MNQEEPRNDQIAGEAAEIDSVATSPDSKSPSKSTKSAPAEPPEEIVLSEEDEAVAVEIIEKLGETEEIPVRQVHNIIGVCGVAFAQKVLRKTFEVEENGGLLTHNRQRRRTVGGVFFFLAKRRMSQAQFERVFPGMEYPKFQKQKAKKKGDAKAEKGAAHKEGRPGREKGPRKGDGRRADSRPSSITMPPPAPALELPEISSTAPPEALERLKQLVSAADTFRKKIAGLEAQPAGQQFGLEMTRKLLENTEKQIDALVKQYSD